MSSQQLPPNTMERTHIKRKMERSAGKMHVKKKRELESKPEDSPQPIGELVKFTRRYPTTNAFIPKRHYEKFQFHGNTYTLEDTVVLTPKGANKKPYVAIIKMYKLCDIIFDEEQQQELDLLVAKTISQAGDLLDIEKKKKSRRKTRLVKSQELVDQIKDGLTVDEGTAENEKSIGSSSESVNSDSYLDDF
ncbi:unnamed protein product [Microthlaspi erraticum]|uniref:Uncharacterized protein n=1 Tax=Microthlaspi erraticum TaxID=1685480 RepID=A0A6D2JBV9_9BRAS|nr:unnamed protein product [Microthlaspi erraticum]